MIGNSAARAASKVNMKKSGQFSEYKHTYHWQHDVPKIEEKIQTVEEQEAKTVTYADELLEIDQKVTLVMSAIVGLSVFLMGLETDLRNDSNAMVFDIIENVFLVIFIVEIFIRVFLQRWLWIRSVWNYLDLMLVSVSLMSLGFQDMGLEIINLLRLFRLARLVRLVKVVKSFEGLYIVLMAWTSAMKSIIHVYGMIFAGLYIYALVATQTIGHNDDFKDVMLGDRTVTEVFGTIQISMYTFFQLMTLDGFEEKTYNIVTRNFIFLPFFISFVLLFTFGLLNMLVGLVVEKTITETNRIQDERKSRGHCLKLSDLNELFDACEEEGQAEGNGGKVHRANFVTCLKNNAALQEILKANGAPVTDLRDLFHMLDLEGDGVLERDEFVTGMAKFHGESDLSIETLATHAGVRAIHQKLLVLTRDLKSFLDPDAGFPETNAKDPSALMRPSLRPLFASEASDFRFASEASSVRCKQVETRGVPPTLNGRAQDSVMAGKDLGTQSPPVAAYAPYEPDNGFNTILIEELIKSVTELKDHLESDRIVARHSQEPMMTSRSSKTPRDTTQEDFSRSLRATEEALSGQIDSLFRTMWERQICAMNQQSALFSERMTIAFSQNTSLICDHFNQLATQSGDVQHQRLKVAVDTLSRTALLQNGQDHRLTAQSTVLTPSTLSKGQDQSSWREQPHSNWRRNSHGSPGSESFQTEVSTGSVLQSAFTHAMQPSG